MDELLQMLKTFTADTLVNAVLTILICVVGWIAIKRLTKLIVKMLDKNQKIDNSIVYLIANTIKALLLFLLIIMALTQLGIPTTSLVAVLGAGSLAISLAMQNSLSNIASGVILLFTKPFSEGDYISANGAEGTLVRVGLIHTILNTIDNKRIYIPNGALSSGQIVNYSAEQERRVELIIPVAYDSDLKAAKQVIITTAQSDSRIDGEPYVRVWNLNSSSVDIMVRVWVSTADIIEVKCALLEEIKVALDNAGISIPFNRLDVSITNTQLPN